MYRLVTENNLENLIRKVNKYNLVLVSVHERYGVDGKGVETLEWSGICHDDIYLPATNNCFHCGREVATKRIQLVGLYGTDHTKDPMFCSLNCFKLWEDVHDQDEEVKKIW